jgi:hypothetical protein
VNNPVPWLRRGKGDTPADGGCVMQIIDWISSNGWTDRPACVFHPLRDMAVAINDWVSDEQRQRLLDLTPRLMNTQITDRAEAERVARHLGHRWDVAITGFNATAATRTHEEGSAELIRMLIDVLDLYDELTGRDTTPEVDYSGVCEVLAA